MLAGQLYFVWDAATDRGGAGGASFACDSLLEFPLSSAASCVWTTDSELTATLDYRATCAPGDNMTALADVLKAYCAYADCSCWPLINASSTVLRVPDTPLMPAAVFVAPERVGSCSDIAIDATASTGSGGRGWMSAAWSVNCSTLPPANLTALRASVAALGAGSDILTVPNALLAAGKAYEFTLTLENFLGFSAESPPLVVAVSAGSIPNLLIVGGATQRSLAPNPLGLFAQASVAVCPGGKSGSTALSYRWLCTTFAGAVSTSVDPRFFKLPACVADDLVRCCASSPPAR